MSVDPLSMGLGTIVLGLELGLELGLTLELVLELDFAKYFQKVSFLSIMVMPYKR